MNAADAAARLEGSTRAFLDALEGVAERAWQLRPLRAHPELAAEGR